MLAEFFIIGLLVSCILIAFGWYALVVTKENKGNLFLVAGALMLIMTGLFLAMDGSGLEIQAPCMNYSSENSYVWDGYCNVTDLFPQELIAYADGVNIEDGTYTSGTLNPGTRTVDQSYYVVKENGLNFNITWNFTWYTYICPEHFHWVGRYEAPANRRFDWYAYNWTASDWDYVGTGSPDVVASGSDAEEVLIEGCTTDFINATNNQIRMKMVTENSGTGDYYIWTDLILVDTESTTVFAESTQVLNCTRDQYNTTYTYGPCATETIGFAFSEMMAVLLLLVGIGTLLGVIGWSQYANNFKEI